MILRLEMILTVMFVKMKNMIFYFKNSKLKQNNTFDHGFCNKFFFSIASYQFFKKYWIFINQGLFSGGKYFLQLYCF